MRTTILLMLVLVIPMAVVHADETSGEQVNWLSVGSSGELAGTSTNYQLSVSVGQTVAGPATSTNYRINAGFLQDFSVTSEHCCVGDMVGNVDASLDDEVTNGDLVRLLDYLFISYLPPDCWEEANMDLSPDGFVTMGDLTLLLDHLYISYNPLPPCP